MPAHCRTDSYPSEWVGLCLWVRLEAGCVPGDLWAAYLLMDGAVIPPGLLFVLGLLSS